MKTFNLLSFIFIFILFNSCGSNSTQKKSDFILNINSKGKTFYLDDVLSLSIDNPKGHEIDSIIYSFNDKIVSDKISFKDSKLGKQAIEATVYFNGTNQNTSRKITVLNTHHLKFTLIKL